MNILKCTIVIFLASFLFSCGGNKEKLEGKWQVTSSFVINPDWGEICKEVEYVKEMRESSSLNRNIESAHKLEKAITVQDSILMCDDFASDYYSSGVYEFNEDGSVKISRDGFELKGNWELIEDAENLLVRISENGETHEQWKVGTMVFNTPRFERDKVFSTDMFIGGGSTNGPMYSVQMELKKQKINL